jgi:hypothetical protein
MILFGPKKTVFLVGKSAEIRLDKAEKVITYDKKKILSITIATFKIMFQIARQFWVIFHSK